MNDEGLEEIRKRKMLQMMEKSKERKEGMKMGNKENKITVYSSPTCPYCTMAKQYLKGKGVQFADIDVSREGKAAQEMMQKSGQMGVPVLDVNGKIIVGFDRAAIDASLVG